MTMRTVLIVSPHFPPVNAPDMHRVRVSLPYYSEWGWRPTVVAIEPAEAEAVKEPLLLETIPADVPVERVKALPARLCRRVGVRNAGLRALPFLYSAGRRILSRERVDLVFLSTTMFPAMGLARLWKQEFGVPYVLDMQDPWVSDYPRSNRPLKYKLMRRVHRALEPWAMRDVDGLMAVSGAYIETLERRYPWLAARPRKTLPFGASALDFDVLGKQPSRPNGFKQNGHFLHGVYVGRGGEDMAFALRVIFAALRIGLTERPELFSRVKLHFIGTDYAPPERARKTVEPVAQDAGVARFVDENPCRIPYFEALGLLSSADFLLVPGSDDSEYTASKVYPYVMARRPLLAVFHERSSVCEVIRQARAGAVVQFAAGHSPDSYARRFVALWAQMLERLPFQPETNWEALAAHSARNLTREQCELFDQVLEQRRSRPGRWYRGTLGEGQRS